MMQDANHQEPFHPVSSRTGTPILRLQNLTRVFKQAEREIRVLDGASIDLWPGEAVGLVGPSGAGKSTLLHVSGLLETPDGGRIIVDGRDCTGLDDAARTGVRRSEMGFVYQFHQLLPEFSAVENVAMPLMILGWTRSRAVERATQLLGQIGLAQRLQHRPAQMSGGEQQRTAICRALANEPKLLLADEPTGNLDPDMSELVFQGLLELIAATGVAALIATHNMELAKRMHRVLRLDHGKLVELSRNAL